MLSLDFLVVGGGGGRMLEESLESYLAIRLDGFLFDYREAYGADFADALADRPAADKFAGIAADAEMAAKVDEAKAQLAKYRADRAVPSLARGTTLHQIVYVFWGAELHTFDEIACEQM